MASRAYKKSGAVLLPPGYGKIDNWRIEFRVKGQREPVREIGFVTSPFLGEGENEADASHYLVGRVEFQGDSLKNSSLAALVCKHEEAGGANLQEVAQARAEQEARKDVEVLKESGDYLGEMKKYRTRHRLTIPKA